MDFADESIFALTISVTSCPEALIELAKVKVLLLDIVPIKSNVPSAIVYFSFDASDGAPTYNPSELI